MKKLAFTSKSASRRRTRGNPTIANSPREIMLGLLVSPSVIHDDIASRSKLRQTLGSAVLIGPPDWFGFSGSRVRGDGGAVRAGPCVAFGVDPREHALSNS